MRAFRLLLVLSAITLANLIQAQYVLKVDIQDMDNYIGKQMIVRVTETPSGREVGRRVIDPIDTADFSFDLYVLLNHRSYTIDFYVDVNSSGDFDPLPTDHAWRRTLNNVTQNTTLTFITDMNFANISMPSAFPYSTYDASWGGKWMNLTFGSTDSIEAGLTLKCDSILGFFKTKGVFGNPAPVEFNYATALPPDSVPSDTIRFSLDPPWTGEVYITNGELHGALSLTGVGLNFTGTVGTKQILALYTVIVGGNPFANGYFYVRELNVNSSTPELEIELVENAEVSCHNGNDAFLSINATGGTPDYSYQWSTGDTTSQILNLIAGDYFLTVTDANGCNTDESYSVSQPSQIVVSSFDISVSCHGTCDGLIDITVTGGTPPYAYSWNNGTTFEDQSQICAGDWEVTVIDANGCTEVLTFSITEPDTITYTITVVNETNGQSDGVITVIATGGVPPYVYSLDGGPPTTSNTFAGLPAGTYSGDIEDINGCIVEFQVEIQNLTAVKDLQANLNIYPNPASSFLYANADVPLLIDILDLQGHTLRMDGKSLSHQIPLEGIVPGLYMLRISDGSGVAYRKVIVE